MTWGTVTPKDIDEDNKREVCERTKIWRCVFIITDKAKLVGEEVKGVGVMKDEELKLEVIEASHTLGG